MDFFSNEGVFVLYLVCLSLIAYVKNTNSGYIKNILFASVNFNTANLILKSGINRKNITNIFLSLNFYFSFSIFVTFVSVYFFKISDLENIYFITVAAGISAFIIIYLNAGINVLFAYIFNIPDISEKTNYNNKIYYRSAGIILLVINILISFTSIEKLALYSGIFFLGLLYLFRFFRFLKINFSEHRYYFYLFLYLCTVEIIPALYILKILALSINATN